MGESIHGVRGEIPARAGREIRSPRGELPGHAPVAGGPTPAGTQVTHVDVYSLSPTGGPRNWPRSPAWKRPSRLLWSTWILPWTAGGSALQPQLPLTYSYILKHFALVPALSNSVLKVYLPSQTARSGRASQRVPANASPNATSFLELRLAEPPPAIKATGLFHILNSLCLTKQL